MSIEFRRFQPGDTDAIDRLNQRLRAAGVSHRVGRESADTGEAFLEEQPIIERMYVAAEGAEIRGAVWLKEQRFWSNGETVRAGWAIYPVSESLADSRFAGVPATLIFGLLRLQPRLMALGMGGDEGPFARLLAGARFANSTVPLQFRVLHASRVLRRMSAARRTPVRRLFSDLAAASGLGRAGNALLTAAGRLSGARADSGVRGERVSEFGEWSDRVWEHSRERYTFAAVRDRSALNAVFPANFRPVSRLRVRGRDGRDLGWVCAQAHHAAGTFLEAEFGDLFVGILSDCFADPEDACDVVKAGVDELVRDGVDLIITNQTHPAWTAAARGLGFWEAPSNLAFYRSPAAEKMLGAGYFITRSDCDGPESSE